MFWAEADEARKAAVAQAVLDARARYAEEHVGRLVRPVDDAAGAVEGARQARRAGRQALRQALRQAQGKLYGRAFATDADRLAHLFALNVIAAN